ncbi:hypothetical protein CLV35_0701 [Motilibacter peucedani]|uniref:Uncharacterized protein n=1 Tax=Motilibacter peucedani TaxID=598650 RepID=A0A420XTW5_9ACTN|nr:hypothetical protein [Motilibacter peucedani]RKS80275.1 hypothetical protein CLV35_0701 [Motilibacter peucedani]
MRSAPRSVVALIAVVLALVAGLLVPGPADALGPATGTETQLVALTVTPSRTSLVGAQLATVTVTAHLVDPDPGGVKTGTATVGADMGATCPCVALGETTAAPQFSPLRVVSLRLSSGTANDGVWQGTTFLGAGNAGRWTANRIIAGDLRTWGLMWSDWVDLDRMVPAEPQFVLQGRDWPVLSIRLPTRTVPVGTSYVVSGAASSSATHRPVPRLRLALKRGDCGSSDMGGGTFVRWVRTDAHGRWSASVRDADYGWCVRFGESPGAVNAASYAQATGVVVRARVTTSRTRVTTRLGKAFRLTGTYAPVNDGVQVDERVGRSWKFAADRIDTRAGRYTATVTPHRRGRLVYRVRAGGNVSVAAAVTIQVEVV